MSFFQDLPPELTEAILHHLDDVSLTKTIWTARFLRCPSEKRLYCSVILPTDGELSTAMGRTQTCFFDTIVQSDYLGQHVIRLVLGDIAPPEGGDRNVTRLLGQAMKKMINLKQLEIYGNPYIAHAHLDSVPFSLTHLVLSTQIYADEKPVPGLLPILQAHPDLVELALDCSWLPDDLVAVLKAEQKGLVPKSGILCPHLKRFDGYDEGLRLFLPMRRIESCTSVGPGADYADDDGHTSAARWLNPVLIPSYQHLRVLEVWSKWTSCSLPTIAPYLTALTHLQLVDDFRTLGQPNDELLLSMGRIPTLQCITLSSAVPGGVTMMGVRDAVRNVCSVLPDIPEIFIGLEEDVEAMYYHYVKGGGIQTGLVDLEAACWPYSRWLRES